MPSLLAGEGMELSPMCTDTCVAPVPGCTQRERRAICCGRGDLSQFGFPPDTTLTLSQRGAVAIGSGARERSSLQASPLPKATRRPVPAGAMNVPTQPSPATIGRRTASVHGISVGRQCPCAFGSWNLPTTRADRNA